MGATKYDYWLTPEGLTLLEGWARDGLTNVEIARECGCSKATLIAWKNRFPEIANALKKGREVVDYEVEQAMLKRALGYDYTETRVESGEQEKVVHLEKHMPGQVSAQKYWLSRRKPKKWGDRAAEQNAEEEQTGCVILPKVGEDG